MLHDIENRPRHLHKGYWMVYYPDHPRAWKHSKTVYLHRLVVENQLGRILNKDEHIHHKNEDCLDNAVKNLQVTTVEGHGRLHRHRVLPDFKCAQCAVVFKPNNRNRKFCSKACCDLSRRKVNRPDKATLSKLVWQEPTRKIAKRLGVSDKAVAKWCKAYNIEKPVRGYWSKIRRR